jgi:DNA-binding MarR family transcriptional regulator
VSRREALTKLLEETPHCLCGNLRIAARVVSASYDAALRPLDLRLTQMSLLTAAAAKGPIESCRLADSLGLDKTTLPRNLRPLERRRLVAIEPGEDRRKRFVRITPAGEELLEKAFERWKTVQASYKKRLHNDEFERTLRQLLRIRAAARF